MTDVQPPTVNKLFWYSCAVVMTGVSVSNARNHEAPWSIVFWLAAAVIAVGAGVSGYRDLRGLR